MPNLAICLTMIRFGLFGPRFGLFGDPPTIWDHLISKVYENDPCNLDDLEVLIRRGDSFYQHGRVGEPRLLLLYSIILLMLCSIYYRV